MINVQSFSARRSELFFVTYYLSLHTVYYKLNISIYPTPTRLPAHNGCLTIILVLVSKKYRAIASTHP